MHTRKPVVAGQFYGGSQGQCLAEVKECLAAKRCRVDLPERIVAGIVPHAGWVFSGDLAALVFSAIKQANTDVDTFIIFGAAHRYYGTSAVVYPDGKWQTPLGEIEVDAELADAIVKTGLAGADANAHEGEHSIEVQIPFIQHLFGGAKIVPVIVPPVESAVALGSEVGNIIAAATDKKIVSIASTDLTHYGPRYGFCPVGAGSKALRWAKEVNDMEFINLALNMQAEKLLETAQEKGSACGPGAAAAVVAVAKKLGRKKGTLIAQTHSFEVMEEKFNQPSEETVGYTAIVY